MSNCEIDNFARMVAATWSDKAGLTWFTGNACEIAQLGERDPGNPKIGAFLERLSAVLSGRDAGKAVLKSGRTVWSDIVIVLGDLVRRLPGGLEHPGVIEVCHALQSILPDEDRVMDPVVRCMAAQCLMRVGGTVGVDLVRRMDPDVMIQSSAWEFTQVMGNCEGSIDEKTNFMDDMRDRFPDVFANEVGRRLHYVCVHGFGDPKDPIPAMDRVPAV